MRVCDTHRMQAYRNNLQGLPTFDYTNGPNAWPPERLARLIRGHENGWGLRKIAEAMGDGTSFKTVDRKLKELGLR